MRTHVRAAALGVGFFAASMTCLCLDLLEYWSGGHTWAVTLFIPAVFFIGWVVGWSAGHSSGRISPPGHVEEVARTIEAIKRKRLYFDPEAHR